MSGTGRTRVNIAMVAADAGVGVGTVSRVLNNSPQVSEATRVRVRASIARLGYRPSQIAAGLARGSTNLVAVVVPHLTRPSVVARLAGIMSVLDAEGYDSIVINVENPEQTDRRLDSVSSAYHAAGVIVVSLGLAAERIADFADQGIATVVVDHDSTGVDRIITDDIAGGMRATDHLLDLGHRAIAFIGDTSEDMGFTSSPHRLRGYRRALRSRGLSPDTRLIRFGPHGADSASELARQLLTGRRRVTAVFATSDTQALGVLRTAEDLGMEVPTDLSVVGFDDIDAAGLVGLTTIGQPLHQSGALGAQRLCARIRGQEGPITRKVLPLRLVERRTTGPPAGSLRSNGRSPARSPSAPLAAPRPTPSRSLQQQAV